MSLPFRLSRSLQGKFRPLKATPYLADRAHCRGEQTAFALETRLAEVESRIDQLLASIQENPDHGESHRPDQTPKENGRRDEKD
jgi:hypothetical protein